MRTLIAIVVAVSMAIAASLTAAAQEPASQPAPAPALAGKVIHANLPVPGASVVAGQGERSVATYSDETGAFSFTTLAPGAWTITVEMRGFVTVVREVTIPSGDSPLAVELTLKRYEEIVGAATPQSLWPGVTEATRAAAQAVDPSEEVEILAGSVTNGAATIFAQPRGMGNNRPRPPSLYTGAFSAALGNSAWNARPYSFAGSAAAIPDYADAQLGITLAGPFKIPGLLRSGPMTRVSYQHGVQHTATSQSARLPTLAERDGNLACRSAVIRDPLTRLPFAGNVIPRDRIAPQASALLAYYPPPGEVTDRGANYERSLLADTTTDTVQVGMQHAVTVRTQLAGTFAYERRRGTAVNLFDFRDTTRQSSVTAQLSWSRRFTTRLQVRANYQFSSASAGSTPFFANRINVSGDAGITGNDQDPLNWGPPTIQFPDFADLTAASYQQSFRASHAAGVQASLRRGTHNMTFGADFRTNGLDLRTPPDARGTLTFTGAATGDAFADFLLGLPAASAISSGRQRARLRGGIYNAYFSDDFRAAPGLTLDLGVRWEYETPYRERDDRLANFDVASGFAAISPVLGSDPTGLLTGRRYPPSLVRRDARGFEPRVGVSWRPLLASSLLIKGGYGLYRNLGVYQSIGTLLAQQPPYSNTFRVQSSEEAPITLANAFPATIPSQATFAVDPDFKTALLHSWQVTVQRELPASLTVAVGYFGDRGTRLAQAFLPNTYAPGAGDPCPSCPSGFTYLVSGGTSTRNAGQFILRRRLYAGFTAGVTYTLAKATDNASTFSNTSVAPGSLAVAQDWLDLDAERAPSSFDQRHLVQVDAQYTTGVGLQGGTLVDGWLGRLYKDWTVTAILNAGSGLPITPVYFATVPGTGVVGLRPALTGAPIAAVASGAYADPAAFTAPASGTWGNAGRNSIRGPSTFSFDVTVARVFRLTRRLTLEWRVAASNVLNRVTFSAVDRIITSPQFGRPTGANQMRRLQSFLSLKF